MQTDPIHDLLMQAYGETLGGLVCGSYRLAQTATREAEKREAAEAEIETLRKQRADLGPPDDAGHGEGVTS